MKIKSLNSNNNKFILLLIVMICFAIIFCILMGYGLSKEDDSYLLKKSLSNSIIDNAGNIAIKNDKIMLEDGTKLYYLEAKSPNNVRNRGNLLYLHGAAFSSHDWNRTKPSILQISAAAGYRTIAIDLPGFSQSRTRTGTSFYNNSAFMSLVIKKLNIQKPIIISPSASGSYAARYVIENKYTIGGFIPVAPCCVRNYDWTNFMVPTLLIYGSDDKASISQRLLEIPHRKLVIIPDAPHAANIKKPADFITALINFLYSINSS